MADFLREHSWCTPETYKWGMSVAQIRLMSYDFTHVEYLDREKAKAEANTVRIESAEDLLGIGIPVINK